MAHPDSNSLSCLHFEACSGCSERLTLAPPVIWNEILAYFDGLVSPILHQGSPIHWRHRAKLAVRGSSADPLIGLFKKHSHDVVPIPSCLVQHPRLNQAFLIIKQWMYDNHLTPYQEKESKGDLRYLQAVVERKSQKIQVSFVLNFSENEASKANHWQSMIEKLGGEHEDLWHSLWVNYNNQRTNTIFGLHWKLVFGEEFLWESFGAVNVCYGPASFGQSNLPLFEKMLTQLREFIPKEARVAEFYAGVGAIGLFIADKCHSVVCCEMNPFAQSFFEQSRMRLSLATANKLTFHTKATEKAFQLLEDVTSVIVDPPRKGLDSSFFPIIKRAESISQLIYVSCGWDSFKRDCEKLFVDGWNLKNVEGYVFFPGSNHIELLANFTR